MNCMHVLQNGNMLLPLTRGPDRMVVVGDFLDWLDFVTELQAKESKRWAKTEATRDLWQLISAEGGFYGRHIESLGDCVLYADNREITSQAEYDYVRDGMKRFMGFHDQLIALLEKKKAVHETDLDEIEGSIDALIQPYLSQRVFSSLPRQEDLPALPKDAVKEIGYIPQVSMMSAFEALPKKPSLSWIRKSDMVKQVFHALYDRGFAHDFLNKLVARGGRFSVFITGEGKDAEITYLPLDGTLYIPQGKFTDGRLNIDEKLLSDLMHELFHVYVDKVIGAGNDPLTKNLLVNVEDWLTEQFVRKIDKKGARTWVEFSGAIRDAKSFTEDYVGKIIRVSFLTHMSIWQKRHQAPAGSRISLKEALARWRKQEHEIVNTAYLVSDYDEQVSWEVQTVPPDFVLDYVHAFYNFGEY